MGVEAILTSVLSMMNDPNCDSPANVDAAVFILIGLLIFRYNFEIIKKDTIKK